MPGGTTEASAHTPQPSGGNEEARILAPPWGPWGRSATLGVVSGVSKLVLQALNTTVVHNWDKWESALLRRQPGTGLLTVCNHTSTADDPAVLSVLTPWSYFWTDHLHGGVRWSLCAREICFKYRLLGTFFRSGKTLPIERGGGVEQPIMMTAARQLASGDWMHVFPEGRVGYSGRLGPFRWGVGALVCDCMRANPRYPRLCFSIERGLQWACEPCSSRLAFHFGCFGSKEPVILPFYHSGMGEVLPKHGRVPRVGRTVTVTVGDPVPVEDFKSACLSEDRSVQQQAWRSITERVREALMQLEEISPPNADQTRGGARQELASSGLNLPESAESANASPA